MLSTLDVKGTYTFCLTKFQTIPVAMHATKNWAHAACFIGAFFLRKLLVPLIILPYMSLVASEFSYSVVFGSLSQFQLEPKKIYLPDDLLVTNTNFFLSKSTKASLQSEISPTG
jgi:hypothetical protein